MKKLLIILAMFVLFYNETFTASKITITTTTTVIRKDPGGPEPTLCPDSGTGCTQTTTIKNGLDNVVITQHPSSGYILQSQIDNLKCEVIRNGIPYKFNSINKSFVFPSGSKVRIDICDDFPSLVNTEVSISGVNVDSLGNFTLQFIP